MQRKQLDRRDFIVTTTAALAAGAGIGACSDDGAGDADAGRDGGPAAEAGGDVGLPPDLNLPPVAAGRVVELYDAQALNGKTPDDARVKAMLRKGLQQLTGQTDLRLAWRVILPDLTSATRVGIKLNCLSSYLYNSAAAVGAVVASLVQDLGVAPERITIWDRRGDEVARSQLTGKVLGASVTGTYKTISDSSGPGYEAAAQKIKSRTTRLAKLLTELTDVTINMSLLKRHNVSGLTGAMKNTSGVIDNPGDFHADFNDHLPVIYALPQIRRHLRLHICEALMAVIKGDAADPVDTLPGRLLLAVDPVAIDTRTLALMDELRSPLPPIATSESAKLKWLENAEALGLGTRTLDLKKVVL